MHLGRENHSKRKILAQKSSKDGEVQGKKKSQGKRSIRGGTEKLHEGTQDKLKRWLLVRKSRWGAQEKKNREVKQEKNGE